MKSVAIGPHSTGDGALQPRQGEFVVTQTGIEGGFVYALSMPIRDALATEGDATIWLDLAPGWNAQRVTGELMRPRDARSMSNHLQNKLNITGVKSGLLRKCLSREAFADLAQLTRAIRAPSLRLTCTRPIEETINTAGGVTFGALNTELMIGRLPGMLCAGEMLDWEAPTGSYLLTTCFASGAAIGQGALDYLARMAR